jgi:O-succinylbenzoic acid--CoA ligase
VTEQPGERRADAPREVRLLEVAPGRAGVAAVYAALPDALAGSGPALGIVPLSDDRAAARARDAVLGRSPSRDLGAVQVSGAGKPADAQDHAGLGVGLDVAVVMATSGSTGNPRGVLLPGAALLASARAAYSRLGGPGAWLLALPVTGVGGLQVLVRSLVAQVEPLVLSSVGGAGSFDPQEFADLTWRLDPSLPAYTSIVPTQAAKLLEHEAGLDALRAYEAVLLGGARTPPALLARLREHHVAAVTTYGMTETSGGMVYDGVPLDGVGVRVLDPGSDGIGRLALTGPTLACGYLGDDELTASTFVDGGMLTGDAGRVTDGVVEVLGRLDDVVQVGGVNVAVQAVEDLLASVSADACVLAAPDETWGSRLTAYVVPSVATPDDDRLAALVTDALGRAAVPRAWVRLDALPHLPNGKPDRETLRRLT